MNLKPECDLYFYLNCPETNSVVALNDTFHYSAFQAWPYLRSISQQLHQYLAENKQCNRLDRRAAK